MDSFGNFLLHIYYDWFFDFVNLFLKNNLIFFEKPSAC